MSDSENEHGTDAGYYAHHDRGDELCGPCYRAARPRLRRDELIGVDRVVSDVLDDWLARMYGTITSQSGWDVLLDLLREAGHDVVPTGLATEGEEWAPDNRDALERFGVVDRWDYPGWSTEKRMVAAVRDQDPKAIYTADGDYEAVCGLLADHDWRRDVAMADAMGLVGDWGVDDVTDAVTEAMHRYRRMNGRTS